METNTQPSAPQAASIPVVPPPSVAAPASAPPPQVPKSSHKLLWITAVVVTLILLGVAGYFGYSAYVGKSVTPTPYPTQAFPSAAPTVTPTPASETEREVDEINVETSEADLKEIEKDATGL